MPRYENSPRDVTATIPIFPDGDYEFSLGEPKPFERTNAKGDLSYGVRFPLLCEEALEEGDPNFVGKRTIMNCYWHSEGAISYTKMFQMAVFGFEKNEEGEKAFNESEEGKGDWSFNTDPDALSVGDSWAAMRGKRVVISMSIGINNQTGDPQQKFVSYRPLGS